LARKTAFPEFVQFLVSFVDELNELSKDGAVVLVEGPRDSSALKDLGYTGRVLTRISLSPPRIDASLRGVSSVIILTDMDQEGRRLASKFIRFLQTLGIEALMSQRRRLRAASHGRFLHIENLSRFAPDVPEIKWILSQETLNTGRNRGDSVKLSSVN
jgi:5S rRNA maturation endonuclease (ribonuclease M5)